MGGPTKNGNEMGLDHQRIENSTGNKKTNYPTNPKMKINKKQHLEYSLFLFHKRIEWKTNTNN